MKSSSRVGIAEFLDRIDEEARNLEEQLVALRMTVDETRSLLKRDVPLGQVLAHSRCPAARGSVSTAAEELIDLLHDHRAETIRILVDEEGWSITDIAKRSGNARQVIARLYHAAVRAAEVTPGAPEHPRARPRPKVRMLHPEG